VRGGTITATILGYSSKNVPRCCPDRRELAKWRWSAGKFVLGVRSVPGRV
jgi:hypothetical protein